MYDPINCHTITEQRRNFKILRYSSCVFDILETRSGLFFCHPKKATRNGLAVKVFMVIYIEEQIQCKLEKKLLIYHPRSEKNIFPPQSTNPSPKDVNHPGKPRWNLKITCLKRKKHPPNLHFWFQNVNFQFSEL